MWLVSQINIKTVFCILVSFQWTFGRHLQSQNNHKKDGWMIVICLSCVCVPGSFFTSLDSGKQLNKANICLCRYQFHFVSLFFMIYIPCQFSDDFALCTKKKANANSIDRWLNCRSTVENDDKIMTNKPQSFLCILNWHASLFLCLFHSLYEVPSLICTVKSFCLRFIWRNFDFMTVHKTVTQWTTPYDNSLPFMVICISVSTNDY